jgi:hypothetical protein
MGSVKAARRPFGMTVRPVTLRLLKEIEDAYGKVVKEEIINTDQFYGLSDVLPDGTPRVRLSPKGKFEESLIHELMHLKLRTQGFPGEISWEYDYSTQYLKSDEGQEFLHFMSFYVKDPIEHSVFNPQIKAMGFRPDPEIVEEFRDAIRNDRYANPNLSQPLPALAVRYFIAMTLPDEAELKVDVKKWYAKRGWIKAAEMGDQMAEVVRQMHPNTPDQEMQAFVKCANIMTKGHLRFELDGWINDRRGVFDQRDPVVMISVDR